MAFFSTPGIERLYSGVTNSRPCAPLTPAFSRLTCSDGVASWSWLYSGRSSMRTCSKLKSGGASAARAVASLRLIESLRMLPTTTAILIELMESPVTGEAGLCGRRAISFYSCGLNLGLSPSSYERRDRVGR